MIDLQTDPEWLEMLAAIALIYDMETAKSLKELYQEDKAAAKALARAALHPSFVTEKLRIDASERQIEAS